MRTDAKRTASKGRASLRAALDDHLGSRHVSRVLYGTVIGLALVVALEHHPPGPGVMVGTILATAVAVGLAELYSDVIGAVTRTRRLVDGRRLHGIAEEVAAVAFGVGFPAVFFALAAGGAIRVSTAFSLAKWSGLGLLFAYGFSAARIVGVRRPAALLLGLAAGIIGGLLIAFKAVLH
jgi:hypothetical protein